MYWSLLSTLLDSFSSILRKRSLELNAGLSAYGFKILGMFGPVIFVPYFLLSGQYSLQTTSLRVIGITIGICAARIVGTNLSQYIYKNEKVSVLMPYENLNKVFTIIASFFILSDGNIATLLTAFAVIAVLVACSIDYKRFTLPSLFALVFIHEIFVSIRSLGVAYLLKETLTYVDYFVLESAILTVILVAGVIYHKDIATFMRLPKTFYSFRLGSGLLGTISYVVGLYLLGYLGLILTILLSFLGIIVKLGLGSLILKEKLKKRDVLLACFIVLLVGVGFIYR